MKRDLQKDLAEFVENEEEKKTYYFLPMDSYNQPDGTVQEIELTEARYKQLKKTYVYVYDSYADAMTRAMV
jgi:hypothetical protein